MAIISGNQKVGAKEAWESDASFTVYDAPDGADAMAVADAARISQLIHVPIRIDHGQSL